MKERKCSAWGELWDSIKFLYESKRGKYSLDTYLDIMSEFTDKLIQESEQDGLTYLGGECCVADDKAERKYDFHVKLYFQNWNGSHILKEARRKLPKNCFTSETAQMVGAGTKFEIQKPA